ncbi:hypothetical protein M758_7G026300 [Ceratodon purpureus]|uniref:Cytochrome P450 n=1 Tax=Ceratodon purpureus TaxID=3225 RepID=A0A8T0H6F7_CERPU|nr:hypothetical protein KC19_7G027600 [Ceratodon purpureus]KAG0609944.1 hypothetical protein M758_7G026300 [Ceratodon purpureus]
MLDDSKRSSSRLTLSLRENTQFVASFMAFSVMESIPTFYVLATTVLVIIVLRSVLRRSPNLPPGPTGLPLIGSLHLLSALPHQNLAELAKKYGPLMSMRLGQEQCIIATSPETAMEFLKNQGANFSSRPPFRAGDVVLYGQDLLCQNATSQWRHHRMIFKTELTGPQRLEATQNVRAEEIAHLIRTLPQNQKVELRPYLSVMLNNVVSRFILNKRLSARSGGHETEEELSAIKNFKEITHEIALCLSAFYPGDFIPALKWLGPQRLEKRFKECNKRMDLFVSKIIAEHEAERKLGAIAEEEKDMVHVLLDEMEKSEEEHRITMTNVKAILWDAFSASVDTILISSEWTLSEVLRKPDVLAKAQEELDNVVGQDRRVLESDIPKLVYIQAIVKEALRLHPPAPVLAPHQSIDACKAFGYDIPAEARVFVNVWAIARDPSLWPNPLEFNPGRFMPGGINAGIDMKGQHFQLLPFGAGRRMCPGKGLGLLIMHYCVASLLHAVLWTDVTNDPEMAEGPAGLSVPRAVPLQVIAKPRLAFDFYTS